MPTFEVPIVYRGQCNYLIKAKTPSEAMAIAKEKFKEGVTPDDLGNEWEEIEKFGEISVIEED